MKFSKLNSKLISLSGIIPGIKKIAMKQMIVNTGGASPAAVTTITDIFGEAGLSSVNCFVFAVNNHEEANPARITAVSIRSNRQVLIYTEGGNNSNMSVMFVGFLIDDV